MSASVAPLQRRRRHAASTMRVHDYLYGEFPHLQSGPPNFAQGNSPSPSADSAYVVSGARDFARSAFKAAMASAQIKIRPIYQTMFCEIRRLPSYQLEYHTNCRLPDHMDRSYGAALRKMDYMERQQQPDLCGRDQFRFFTAPREVLPMTTVEVELDASLNPLRVAQTATPPTPAPPITRSIQTQYRESSAQTRPWEPPAKTAEGCAETPEVLYLDKMAWGPGEMYRTGDLPADFHTTEIINKMRHAREWTELVEKQDPARGAHHRDAVITDVETRDWLFREAEIDELQGIRLQLLREEISEKGRRRASRVQRKLQALWASKKQQMQSKVEAIRHARDRGLRKLRAAHGGGGATSAAERRRSERGGGEAGAAAGDVTSDLHAPRARHGYQARRRNADITYYPDILGPEEQARLCAPPAWLSTCGTRLARTCSGHARARDATQLCERETRWDEGFLRELHSSLKKARLGAAEAKAGPCRLLVPRGGGPRAPRPATPSVDAVSEREEGAHQAALVMQRVLRGRAVQVIMLEGRTRAGELTEELKTTHGLQPYDKGRVRAEQHAVRDQQAEEAQRKRKEAEIAALATELSGGAISGALDFLEKELKRLRTERMEHAFVIVATREKQMREAAEAGRRQLEEQRRREHDAMFKQVVGVTQETVEAYMRDIINEGAELCAEEEAVRAAALNADAVEAEEARQEELSTLGQNELVAELVHRLALPEVKRRAARRRLEAAQSAGLSVARDAIFGHIDRAEIVTETCTKCGRPAGAVGAACACALCPGQQEPREMPQHREDPRWRYIRRGPEPSSRDVGERFPPAHDFRCMLDAMIDDAVVGSRERAEETHAVLRDVSEEIAERFEVTLDCKQYVSDAVEVAMGAASPPPRLPDYHHFMYRRMVDAIDRDTPKDAAKCPELLPSDIRQQEEYFKHKDSLDKGYCLCKDLDAYNSDQIEDDAGVLPSDLRALEQLRRCKCDEEVLPMSPASSLTDTSKDASKKQSEVADACNEDNAAAAGNEV